MRKLIIYICTFSALAAFSREKAGVDVGKAIKAQQQAAMAGKALGNCSTPKAARELWVNNVRTIIFNGGDMWWDLFGNTNAYYYIPASTNRASAASSAFAGAVWIGGYDGGGQLKVAAMTYRQNGIDFWPGPLDTANAEADADVCSKYDQIFQVSRSEVDNFVVGGGPITSNIDAWPGNADPSLGQALHLAPFEDVNNDGLYDPLSGDYPGYDVYNKATKDNLGVCKAKLYGDYTLFWVYNDKGGVHSETQGVPIGIEVRAQAFAFKTNDEINNMTFYSYEIHNRSSFQINKTYFTIWNDADLGYYLDDYVGCDTKRGLGYIYNANANDLILFNGTPGYGDYPPAIGCDFFRGPLADPNDGIDNDFDADQTGPTAGTDEIGETIQMSKFLYYNNNIGPFPNQTVNPDIAIHYYYYMTGFWKDGSPFTANGNAYGGSTPVNYVYDGDPVAGTGWTERTAGNLAGDRRFLQSAGPFTLKPGAVNNVTFGMPWAQAANKGGNLESITLLKTADDKAQALFDNCFKLLDGPEAPDMTIQEMNGELLFYLTNRRGLSNNFNSYNNDYDEQDISISSDPSSTIQAIKSPDKHYRFEGYIVYQVKDDKVTSTDLKDVTKAVPVFQCDVKNGVSRLVNYVLSNSVGGYIPSVMVDGADKGMVSTFRLTEDAFASGENKRLINNKTYFYYAVAYAHNNYLTYVEDISPLASQTANYLGQKRPYLEGRKTKRASAIPNNPVFQYGGNSIQANYGTGVKVTRLEGQGNGGNLLTLTKASEDAIVASSNGFKDAVTYENGQGPVSIKVVDPLGIIPADFTFRLVDFRTKGSPDYSHVLTKTLSVTSGTTTTVTILGNINTVNPDSISWELYDKTNGRFYYPNLTSGQSNEAAGSSAFAIKPIKVGDETFFPELGFSVKIGQVSDPGELANFTNFGGVTSAYTGPAPETLLGASMAYANSATPWLNPVKDVDGGSPQNWILCGTNKTAGQSDAYYNKDANNDIESFIDPQKQFGEILDGTWAPYPLCAGYYPLTATRNFGGPAYHGAISSKDASPNTNSVTNNGSLPYGANTDLRKISSVLIVYTKDQSKWTRCPVLEMQEVSELANGNSFFFEPRRVKSVDKNGIAYGATGCNTTDAALTSTTGMGWFPGYAINIETGERLNMAFGEDSYQKENQGDDMVWNPTSNTNFPYSFTFGGKHFVYVFGNSIEGKGDVDVASNPVLGDFAPMQDEPFGAGPYDGGLKVYNQLSKYFGLVRSTGLSVLNGARLSGFAGIERDIMWVSMPMTAAGYTFKNPKDMPCDVRIQINVSKPYRYGYSGMLRTTSQNWTNNTLVNATYSVGINRLFAAVSSTQLPSNIKTTGVVNNNFPMYSFSTKELAALYGDNDIAKNSLDLIKVVPNPYYGNSTYETKRLDTRVRITNLPNKCTIKIFSLNGTLIKTIKRDVTGLESAYTKPAYGDTPPPTVPTGDDINRTRRPSYVDWELKNQSNIPIASGLYIFHIEAKDAEDNIIGEKIIKWFGVMRPLDLQNY
ncbi:MAG: hypothetical protein SGJ15_15060 [Bacteroidota bacterium]|nr:hypothetical protein [Bacteroidota bacterium]